MTSYKIGYSGAAGNGTVTVTDGHDDSTGLPYSLLTDSLAQDIADLIEAAATLYESPTVHKRTNYTIV